VNWEEWGLYDYLQIVKVPMDMGTVRVKLNKDEYKTPQEFAKDMRLIWDNCKLYNQVRYHLVPHDVHCSSYRCQDGSDLYTIAHNLAKLFDARMKEMKLDDGATGKSSSSLVQLPTNTLTL
jgi:hypothetical protein